jgi:hypothetical protein
MASRGARVVFYLKVYTDTWEVEINLVAPDGEDCHVSLHSSLTGRTPQAIYNLIQPSQRISS